MQFAWKTWSYTAEHPNIQCNIFYYSGDATLTHTHIHTLSRVKIIEILPMLPDGKEKCEVSLFVSEEQICFSFSLRIVTDSFSNDPLPRIHYFCFLNLFFLLLLACLCDVVLSYPITCVYANVRPFSIDNWYNYFTVITIQIIDDELLSIFIIMIMLEL